MRTRARVRERGSRFLRSRWTCEALSTMFPEVVPQYSASSTAFSVTGSVVMLQALDCWMSCMVRDFARRAKAMSGGLWERGVTQMTVAKQVSPFGPHAPMIVMGRGSCSAAMSRPVTAGYSCARRADDSLMGLLFQVRDNDCRALAVEGLTAMSESSAKASASRSVRREDRCQARRRRPCEALRV